MFKRLVSITLLVALLLGLFPATFVSKAEAAPSASTATITALFEARSQGVHPRILASKEDFSRIRKQIQTDPYMRVMYERVYDYCVSQLSEAVSKYEIPDGVRLLGVSRTASQRIVWLSLAYQISGERRFADRAIAEMVAVSKFSDWHPQHYLDVAQMAYGVGLGYDWLYHEMTSAQRNTVCSALYNYAVATATGKDYQNGTNNWNPWCHGGVTIAAAAIFESYPSACASYLSASVTNIQKALNVLAPLGAYPEGPGYFSVAVLFTALFCDTLATVLGTDFGVSDLEGVRESGNYLLAMNGFVSTFNFGDGSNALQDTSALHWFASRFSEPQLSVYQRERQTTSTQADDALALLWYDAALASDVSADDLRLDHLMYSNAYESVASFRSPAGDARQIYTAIKSGSNNTSHSDLDIGTFVLEAMGTRFLEDMGSDNYNMTGYFKNGTGGTRWNYYRKRAEGQNTLVLNPDSTGGQDALGKAQITSYGSTYDGGYATVNMLDAYDNYGATAATRGLLLFDNRSRVLLRDEITCSSASTLYWFAHTRATVTLSSDKKTATLVADGKTLLAQIASPSNATFTVMDAQPLSTSPKPSGENSRDGWKKLTICLKNVKSANISVVFTPVLEDGDANKALPTATIATLAQTLKAYAPGTELTQNAEGVYEIHNIAELRYFADMVNSGKTFEGETVKLMADIDMNGQTFVPIGGGGTSASFKGTFDGGKHTISNLCIFKPGTATVGLFGRADYATIRDLGIANGVVFGGEKSAALVGLANHCTLEGCFNRANFIGNGGHVGGLIGQLGGTSTISNCYNHSNVRTSGKIAGGIIGYISSSSSLTLSNSYHVGNLTDSSGHCGMIGYYNTSDTSMLVKKIAVTNCFSTASLKDDSVANLASVESYSGSAKLTAARMVSAAPGLGSAYIADCKWENDGYPVFAWQCDTTLPEDLHLSTAAELRLLAHTVNSGADTFAGKTVYLSQDIDLDSREWVPIGGNSTDSTANMRFKGTFDGQGYSVRNLRISAGNDFSGFFGVLQGALLNFGVQSGSINGNIKVGGLVGWFSGTMTNCYNQATVTASNYVGGLVGMSGASHITNSYNNADVSGGDMSGGIIGYYASNGSGSTITNCYHNGTVTGSSAGSMAGVINSSATGLVFKNSYAPKGFAFVYSSSGRTLSGCSTLVEADLKAAATKLGAGFADDTVRSQNSGYPILNRSLYKGAEVKELQPEEDGVYRIYTARDLYALSYMVNVQSNTFAGKTVQLCTDLDLQGQEWTPIGGNYASDSTARPEFSGHFDGQGHKIYNLCVSSGNYYVGLFGFMRSGSVKNVGIESGVVFGSEKAAGLVGAMRNTQIENCYNKANVSAYTIAGGIYGMCGAANNNVENCYNTGWIGANSSAGGIAGYLASDAKTSVVRNCYNLGAGSPMIGTVNAAATDISIENSYTHNAVGLTGTQNGATITNSSALAAADLRAAVSQLGAAYAEDYQANNGLYPVLSWENGDAPTALTVENGIYTIGTAEELRLLSYLVRKGNKFSGKNFVLTADIDLENRAFLPIGGGDEIGSTSFNGRFDGKGHVIRNLTTAPSEYGGAGLFGQTKGAVIENVGIESGLIVADNKAAGLVGILANGSVMRNCYNKAIVYANSICGGVAGMISGSGCVIESCYNTGWISAAGRGSNLAGVVGYYSSNAANSIVKNCYNVGNFYGLVGNVNSSATQNTLENSYSAGSVLSIRTASSLTIRNAGQVSADTLKGYAAILGEAFVTDTENVNKGYPILAWENAEHCFHDYAIISDGAETHSTVCTLCGDRITEPHKFGEGVVTKTATCTEDGVLTYTCDLCNEIHTEGIPATGHTEVVDKAVAATCTTAGKTEGSHCSVCNAIIKAQTTVAATGHRYTSKVTTAATCTAAGVKTYTCSTCNHSYTEAIAATGHTVVKDAAVPATCTNSGLTEGAHCSVCNTVLVEQETVARLGHDYSNHVNNGETHTATCSRCDKAQTSVHSYTNGTCICGAKEILPPVLDESINILHTLNLASDIAITFAVPKTTLASYDSYYLECVIPKYEGNTLVGSTTVQVQPVATGGYYYFTLTGITAVQMNDTVDAVLHMTKGTQEYYSKTDSYSVATYAYNTLNGNANAKMMTLCADLLRYGAEAQSYKKYRTDALVDADMTATHRSYLSNTNSLTFSETDSYLADLQNPTITWVGKTLDLGSKVGIKFVFDTKNYSSDISGLSMKVTYVNSQGETTTVTLTDAEAYGSTGSYYSFTFYGLLASELRTAIDVAVYEGETRLSETMRYSAETYASKTIGNALEPLTRALFAYSDSAKAYFTK